MLINAVFNSSTSAAPAGFFTAVNAAVEFWERELINPITVTIDFGYSALGTGTLGSSEDELLSAQYSGIRSALSAAATSADDKTAVAHLPSAFPTTQAQFLVPYSEALALGLAAGVLPPTQNVNLTSTQPFTFDPLDRAVAGAYDAVGVLEHEISEVLGRVAFSGDTEFGAPAFAPLDFFRYTAPNQLQLSQGSAFFSIDGGVTHLLPFNDPTTGADAGDWETGAVFGDSFGAGTAGIASLVSPTDLRVMDVLGYTLAPDPLAPHDFYGDGQSQMLLEDTSGKIEVGQVTPAKQFGFTYESVVSPQWRFVGTGDYLGEGHDAFLIENSSGLIDLGDLNGGKISFTHVTTVGSQWTLEGTGDYLGGAAQDQFLIENTTGVIDIGQFGSAGGIGFTHATAVSPQWKFAGTGDYLGKGDDQFLVENASGMIDIGQFIGGNVGFTYVTTVGSQWKFAGTGDYLSKGDDQFLVENTASGVVDVGQFGAGGKMAFIYVTTVGSQWTFEGSGDYLAEGHDQFLIENTAGVVLIGDVTGGVLHFTHVSDLASQWTIHA